MNITMTIMKQNDNCQFFADVFSDDPKVKFGMSAKPVTFLRRPLFVRDTGDFGPMLVLSLVDAKKMAEDILKL